MTEATTQAPDLRVLPARGETKAVVLVLHGGAEHGSNPVRLWSGPYLRMWSFALDVQRAGRPHGLEVCVVRNRVRGWNRPALDPVRDARWALADAQRRHPGLPVVLIGHSMGGRVALRVADDERVAGVVALAPWTTDKDWVDQVRGVPVLIAHGLLDRITLPEDSYAYAVRASAVTDVVRFELPGETHALLRRMQTWHRLVRAFTLHVLGVPQDDAALRRGLELRGDERLRVRI